MAHIQSHIINTLTPIAFYVNLYQALISTTEEDNCMKNNTIITIVIIIIIEKVY